MNRVWTALLLLATVVVAGAVGYVLVHNDKVPNAGKTPGFASPTVSIPDTSGVAGTTTHSASTSASGSSTVDPSKIHIAFLGDNWTNGQGVKHDASKAFPGIIGKDLKVQVSVIAADGSGYAKRGPSDKTFGTLARKVTDANPNIVIVSGGRNDVSDDANTLTDEAKALFENLKSKLPNAKLFAVAPFWGDSDHPSDLGKVDTAVKTAVTSAGGTYWDIPDPLHGHADWMADAANPDEQGNKAIATALESEIKPLLG